VTRDPRITPGYAAAVIGLQVMAAVLLVLIVLRACGVL
jgi:hypothetical protein